MGDIRVIDVEGGPAARGRAVGQQLAAEIAELLERWNDHLRAQVGDPHAFAHTFLAETQYVAAIERWTPHLLDEVAGMAEGAGVDGAELLVAQFVDECWAHAAAVAGEHCSSIGVAGADGVAIGQNMDLEAFRDGLQVVVRHRQASGPDLLVLTCAGVIAFNGVNRAGVAVCVNSLAQLAPARHGLPVAFVIRAVLDAPALAMAEDIVRSVDHATGQNYMLGDPSGIVDVECAPGQVVDVPTDPVVLHTNHPLVGDHTEAETPELLAEITTSNSYKRLESLRARIRPGDGVERIKAALSATDDPRHPVSRRTGAGSFFTFASTVMELADPPTLHVSAGPPADVPYATVRF